MNHSRTYYCNAPKQRSNYTTAKDWCKRMPAIPTAIPTAAPDVEDHSLGRVRENGGEVVRVLLVPAQTHERRQIVRLVDDGGVLERAEVEHSNAAIRSHRCKYVLRSVQGTNRVKRRVYTISVRRMIMDRNRPRQRSVYLIKNKLTTSAVSSTNSGSIFIFASCVIHRTGHLFEVTFSLRSPNLT